MNGDGVKRGPWLHWLLPGRLLRVESAVVFLTMIWLYDRYGGAWWLFSLLFFVPDLSAIGYAFGPTAGAVAYNAAHAYVLPAVAVSILGYWSDRSVDIAIIWAAHIAFDRTIGYGLKYPGARKETHLQRVERF